MRIGENGTEALTDLWAVQISKEDAVIFRIRESLITPACASEFGIEIDRVADIADDQKRWSAMIGRQGSDIIAPLIVGAFERFIKSSGAPLAVSELGATRLGGIFLSDDFGGALLRLTNKVPGFIQVDVIGHRSAVRIGAGDSAVKDVEIFLRISRRGIRWRDFQKSA